MARGENKPNFRIIPQSGGYPGVVGLMVGTGPREIVMLGSGKDVEAVVLRKVREIEGG